MIPGEVRRLRKAKAERDDRELRRLADVDQDPVRTDPSAAASSWVEEFIAWARDVRNYTPATEKSYRATLRDFDRRMGIVDHSKVTPGDLDRYATRLMLANLARSRRTRLIALKSYFAFGASRGYIKSNPAADLPLPMVRETELLSKFTTGEIERLIFRAAVPVPVRDPREPEILFDRRCRLHDVCEKRDQSLLSLMYSLGLRADEPGRLERRDYRVEGKAPTLTIRQGKRSRAPVEFRIDQRVAALLDDYLLELARYAPGHRFLFPPLSSRDPRGLTRGIGRNQVREILLKRIRVAGIVIGRRRLSPHALRVSIATHLYEQGRPIPEIQTYLRHRSYETTLRYVRLGSAGAIQKRMISAFYWNANRVTPPASPPRARRD
jgi:site-specific recombinase XerD